MSTRPERDPLNPHELTPQPEDFSSIDSVVSPGLNESEEKEAARNGFQPLPLPPEGDLPLHPDPLLFQSWSQPEIIPPVRIPHLGHLAILAVIFAIATVASVLIAIAALHFHLFGVSNLQQANTDIHYTLGTQAVLYLLTFCGCLFIFPLFWHKSFMAGLQWNGATALRLRGRLIAAAGACFVLAIVDQLVLPGPANTPIDKLFQTPLSAWLLFAFGVTFAPFFEELLFRGFLLPALCTAWDWAHERATGEPARPLAANGHPQWSLPAMAVASLLTSVPFALMHAEQTAYSWGPFLLLVCVSLVLCWARLSTRSLAASVMVHASYNLLLFSLMLLGTGGFQHLDKM
jgi:membrane protease YdiL (CAAX protease family)